MPSLPSGLDSVTPAEKGWSPPRLLTDAPVAKDAFEGTHERLGAALSDIIGSEEGGRAVALVGPYGSGKSTVVEILRGRLRPTNVEVFTYDAWSHSGDPLRRAFVEELVDFLGAARWATQSKWDKLLGKLSRRVDDAHTTTTPRLTVRGYLFAFSVLLTPLGLAVSRMSENWDWVRWAGMGLLVAPVAIALIVLVVSAICNARRKHELRHNIAEPGRTYWQRVLADASAILVKDKHTITESKTIRTPDPTTVEFRDAFRQVVKDALSKPKRKLVIVIDNLDRLNAQETKTAWATMRTFLDRGASKPEEWEKRLWVLAPFDADALRQSGVPGGSSQDLIDKTFALVLRVPPPVLSDWRAYFETLLEEAFPYWHETHPEERRRVFRLYAQLRVADSGPPTPRAMKLFINRLAGLDHQWQGQLPLSTLATYLLVADHIGADGLALLDDGLLKPRDLALLPSRWRRQLAAVHFNVAVEKADQVLAGDSVGKALENGDGAALRKLVILPGIDEVVLNEVARIAQSESLLASATAMHALSDSELASNLSLDEARRALVDMASLAPQFGVSNVTDAERLRELAVQAAALGKPKRGVEFLVRGIKAMVPVGDLGDEERGNLSASDWADQFAVLAPTAADLASASGLPSPHLVLGGEESIAQAVSVLAELAAKGESKALLKQARAGFDAEELVSQLVSRVQNSRSDAPLLALHQHRGHVLDAKGDALEWKPDALNAAVQWRFTNNATALSAGEAKAIARLLTGQPTKQGSFTQQIAKGGQLHNHLWLTHQAGQFEAAAALVSLLVSVLPGNVAPANVGNATNGHSLLTGMLSDPTSHKKLVRACAGLASADETEWYYPWSAPKWVYRADKRASHAAISSGVLCQIIESEEADGLAAHLVGDHLFKIDTLRTLLGKNLGAVVDAMLLQDDLMDRLFDDTSTTHFPADLYDLLKGRGTDAQQTVFEERLLDRIQSLTEEQWATLLETDTGLIQTADRARRDGLDVQASTGFAEAVRGFSERLVEEEGLTSSAPADLVAALVSGLDTVRRETLLRDLRDLALRGLPALRSLIPSFGLALIQGPWEEKDVPDRAVRGLFSEIVRTGEAAEVEWLRGVFETNEHAATRAEKESRLVFCERAMKRGKKSDDGMLVTELRAVVNVALGRYRTGNRVGKLRDFANGKDAPDFID